MPSYVVVLVVVCVVLGLGTFLMVLGRADATLDKANQEKREGREARGVQGTVTVRGIRRTGITRNHQPELLFELSAHIEGRADESLTGVYTVSPLMSQRIAIGSVWAATLDSEDLTNLHVVGWHTPGSKALNES